MLIGALLVGQVATFLHQATVTHTRCAEHGELTHGAGEGGAEPGASTLAGAAAVAGPAGLLASGPAEALRDRVPVRDSAHLRGLPAADDDHEHDHCWMTCAERARAGAGDGQAVAAAPPTGGAARLVSGVPARAPVPLYRTAPKTSPPV